MIPDCVDNLLTTSLIGTLKISSLFSSIAIASSVSLRFGKNFDAISAINLSSSLLRDGVGFPFLISSATGLKISSILCGVNSSTSTPESA